MRPEPSDDTAFEHALKEHVIVAVVDVHADQHGPLDLEGPLEDRTSAFRRWNHLRRQKSGWASRFAKQTHRSRPVDTVTPYQALALIEIGLRIHDWISNDKRATFDRAVDGRMSRTRDVQPTKNAVVGWNCRGPLGPIPNGVSSDKADLH
jgi:hypothetical protein